MTGLVAVTEAAAGCGWMDIGCVLTQAGQQLVETVTNAALTPIADVFLNAWAQLEMLFLSSWIAIPLLTDVTAPNGTVAWLQETLGQFTFLFAALGALVTAAWTFIALGPQRVKNLGGRLLVLLLISTSGAVLVATLDWGVRQASIWLLTQVGAGSSTSVSGLATTAMLAVSPGITLIIGIIAVIGVLVQWVIMIARGPLVVLLLGLWPLTAAAATLGVAKAEASFERVTAWLFAFVIYPFPAALVYAAAFRLKSGQDGIGGVMYGLVLELIAILMLPAIFRIIAPQTKVLGEKFGGGVAAKAAISVAETAVAVGAAVVGAGALSGMLAAKAGAAGAGTAGAGSGGGGLAGAFHGGQGGGPQAATGGGKPAPNGAGAGSAGGGAASGAAPVNADTPTPTGAGPAGGGAASGAAPVNADTPARAGAGSAGQAMSAGSGGGGGGPSGARTPGQDRREPQASPQQPAASAAATPPPAATRRSPGSGAQAAGQAAYAAGQNAGRTARESLDDIDDIVGGRHD